MCVPFVGCNEESVRVFGRSCTRSEGCESYISALVLLFWLSDWNDSDRDSFVNTRNNHEFAKTIVDPTRQLVPRSGLRSLKDEYGHLDDDVILI